MFEILKQNVTADRNGLYRSLATQCGVARVGKAINEAMDAALNVLVRDKSVEQHRLLEAAADAVKNPTKAEVKPVDSQPTETFEEVAVEKHFEFPAYKAVDFLRFADVIITVISRQSLRK